MLEPLYQPGVAEQLDDIENDPQRTRLWNEVVRTLNKICDEPETAASRRYELRNGLSQPVWRVPIPSGSEKENYSLLWSQDGPDAVIHYVGPWPPQQG